MKIPTIKDGRLLLRPFSSEDAPKVAEYCSAWELADTTANIPHPYDQSMAEEWIGTHQSAFDKGEGITFAITLAETGALVGAIGLSIHEANRLAEVGYWVGKPHWSKGYATKATELIIAYAFEELDLNRVQARHMMRNPASGRVMEKAGMKLEGILRQSIYRWESFEDMAMYSILREEYDKRGRS